ncbi:unnamed protein product [Arctogadus glacialis]
MKKLKCVTRHKDLKKYKSLKVSHVWHCEYEGGFRQEVTGTVVLGKQLDPEHKEDEGVDCGLPQERPYPSPSTSTTELWRGFTQSKTSACTVATHSPGINYKV